MPVFILALICAWAFTSHDALRKRDGCPGAMPRRIQR